MTYEDNNSLTIIENLQKAFGSDAVKFSVMFDSAATVKSVRASICPGDMTKYIAHIIFGPMDWREEERSESHAPNHDIVLIGNHPMELRAYCLPETNAPMHQSYFNSHVKGLSEYDGLMHLSILNAVMGHIETSKEVRP